MTKRHVERAEGKQKVSLNKKFKNFPALIFYQTDMIFSYK